ncbi:glutamate synthase large subunit [Woodsholea maritima]|uniref:glutamate synthase large subunit n=1 Tax=Woodsholea maritima TaxID=240237 RepID=UPI000361D2FB|nr:glutamate synthase large subunit [Woodsholea maritima]
MTHWTPETYLAQRQRLIEAHAYKPEEEHASCGVGLICAIDGQPRREIVELALKSLKAVWHRGAVDADGKTGDGAGVRVDIAQDFFKDQIIKNGHTPGKSPIGVGMVFLPRTDFAAQDKGRTLVETEILAAGFRLMGWRQVPVNPACLGQKAAATRPAIEQILFQDPKNRTSEEVSRTLYLVRRRIESQARRQTLSGFYLSSLSAQDVIYKGMFLAEDIDVFYPDLTDPRFVSRFAIYHQRYSTNTFPEWKLAQPFRMLAHNGEINTLKGNVNWMKSHEIRMASEAFRGAEQEVCPVIQPGSSDSAALDQVFEILVHAGRSAPMAKTLLIPEAWSKRTKAMPAKWRALYEYCNSVMEPWDGPAAIAAYDGRWAIAGLDRSGLRPLRFALTQDGLLAVGSETGMTPLDEARVRERGALMPGRMLAIDLDEGRFYAPHEILDKLADEHPYQSWLKNVRDIEAEIGKGPEDALWEREALERRQAAAGLSLEDLELILAPMAETGKEAIGSMGDDSPLAVLSTRHRPLYHYFRQNFSQVTNPPIDPLREGRVMSLKTRFKNLGNILAQDETQTDVYVLDSPVLTNGMVDRLKAFLGDNIAELDATFPAEAIEGDGEALKDGLERIKREAASAIRDGASHLLISDMAQGPEHCALPMALVVGAVHTHLTQEGLRTYCSLNVRAGDVHDAHALAVLVGLGATTVNPYLAFETGCGRESASGLSREQKSLNIKRALEAGLLKIMSKMGISVVSSYRGGCNFEVLGLSRALAATYLGGVTSRISGIGLAGIEIKLAELHHWAWQGHDSGAPVRLPIGGFYRQRASGERHAFEAEGITHLQRAVREDRYDAFRHYVDVQESREPIQLRDLLAARPLGPALDIAHCESVNDIRQRFVTPGMSLGALSPEAHGALNVAMNRIGAKSVSGEGGEDPSRYNPQPNGDNMNSAIKQVASGRFGVTAEYLNQCREIEIKVAQGAKPGEGGQLPGFKVTEFIARMRLATPGRTLISPPPHHDIYSIEDLAQLIYDLKQINPDARVCVKLVASAGVGAVAAGVAKADADVILISGNVGGTGASAQTSLKFAGSPLELGLSEVHQVLSLNGLRERITLRADGGIRTGRDVIMAAMLGAEEFGIGTTSLIALGCLMVRQCHSNTCPVGVCTQDEALREKFRGLADHVVNLMTFIARDTREHLARLGAKSLEDIIGRSDLLDQVSRGADHLDDLDLNALLVRVDPHARPPRSTRVQRNPVAPSLDELILQHAAPVFSRGEKMELVFDIQNTERTVGTRVSSAIVRKYGPQGLPDGQLTLRLKGSAGQSLGAFAAKGLRLDLEGDANDYVGKGLSGAVITIRPFGGSHQDGPGDVIIGNTVLYGATSGQLFAAGGAGQRFAVRNSGADVVVEGCGANGCEYMTGGTAVILGKVGDNFAAGMTGGEAFVLDDDERLDIRLNRESVTLLALSGEAEARCKALIEAHVAATGSRHGQAILSDWARYHTLIRHIVPMTDSPSAKDIPKRA